MKHYLIAILVLMGVYAVGQSSSAQSGSFSTTDSNTKPVASRNIDSAKEADIRQLMQLTGADKLADQMMVNLEANLKPVLTNTFPPGEYREKLVTLFFAKLHSKASAGIMDIAIPAYDKYFSDEEIRELTAFYETPIGKKSVMVLPQLMTELIQTSQAWGQQLGKESLQEVFQERPDLKQAMEEAEKKSKVD